MVHWLNFDLGGWVILIVLLGLVFSLGNVTHQQGNDLATRMSFC